MYEAVARSQANTVPVLNASLIKGMYAYPGSFPDNYVSPAPIYGTPAPNYVITRDNAAIAAASAADAATSKIVVTDPCANAVNPDACRNPAKYAGNQTGSAGGSSTNAASQGATTDTSISGISGSTLMLIGAAVIGFMFLSKKGSR
jgi:hypothetical protein